MDLRAAAHGAPAVAAITWVLVAVFLATVASIVTGMLRADRAPRADP